MLESHLAALSFDDPAAFLVLADWLQGQQDPWGELIALQSAGKPELAPRIAELLAAHGPTLVGTAQCEWKYGFVTSATLMPDEPTPASMIAAMTDFFARPVARLCDGLVLAPLPAFLNTTQDSSRTEVIDPYRGDCDALYQSVPERITRLGFGPWPSPPVAGYVQMPDFRTVSGWFQRVTHLTLVGYDGRPRSPFLLPNCTRLELRCATLHDETPHALLASELPVLEYLTLSCGGYANCILDDVYPPADYDDDNPDAGRYPPTYSPDDLALLEVRQIHSQLPRRIATLGAAKNLSALRHLSLASSSLNGGCIEELAKAPLVTQLESLDLSDGCLTDADVSLLIDGTGVYARQRFAHLAHLDLRRNKITAKTAERIVAALPNADVSDQDPDHVPSFFMRYVSTME